MEKSDRDSLLPGFFYGKEPEMTMVQAPEKMLRDKIMVTYVDDRPVVSARELHDTLGIRTAFRIWFPRMCEYGFVEGLDYTKIYQKKEGSRTGQIEVDYEISMDMAKHICMMQRTPAGMECRKHFIELEKAWNSPEQILARALQIAGRQIDQLQNQCRSRILPFPSGAGRNYCF